MSRDTDQILGHAADNDGIDEYDNALPGWWLGLFFFTILWGIGYALDYHFVRPTSQAARYRAEMAAAKVRWPESAPRALAFDAATLAAGGEIFTTTCASCHGAELTGGIGPSLVDTVWINGAEPEQIRATITDGVASRGMPAWGPVLGPDKVAKVAAYVYDRAKAAGATGSNAVMAAAAPAAAETATEAPTSGEAVFRQNCVVCHGEHLEGKIGPSLVDANWIHGSTLAEIERVITDGVPDKGMVTWGPILGPEKVKLVASYIHERAAAAQTP